MRPEFGCRIHDHVFGPGERGDRRARSRTTSARRSSGGSRGSTSVDVGVSFDADRVRHALRRRQLRDPRQQRPAQPGLPVLRHPRRTTTLTGPANPPAELEVLTRCCPHPTSTTALPGPRRRRQAAGPAALPEWTDHNVSDPGVTLIEAFAQMVDQLIYRLNRVPDLQLRQVPRADRCRAAAAGRGAGRRDVLAVRAAAADRCWSATETQVATPADRHPRAGRLLHHRATCSIVPVRVRPGRRGTGRRRARST